LLQRALAHQLRPQRRRELSRDSTVTPELNLAELVATALHAWP